MNFRMNVSTRGLGALILAPVIALTACGGGEGDPTGTPTPSLVDVPSVASEVASGDFCALLDEIRCAGAVGCCSAEEAPYASVDACKAASTCVADLQELLASGLVSNGTVYYDAAAAGSYLQSEARLTSSCDPARDRDTWVAQVFLGTLPKGANCAPSEPDDVASGLVCVPGLYCEAYPEAASGVDTFTCKTALPSSGDQGDNCSDDEGCNGGACVDGQCQIEPSAVYCEAPHNAPDANSISTSTTGEPQGLRVTANSNTNSGTTNDITLLYRNQTATYSCTITATIADGGTQECVPVATSLSTSLTDLFYVKYADSSSESTSSDGLRITTVASKRLDLWDEHDTFDRGSNGNLDCSGCNSNGNDCNSCWIDSDDHNDCVELRVQFESDDNATCIHFY